MTEQATRLTIPDVIGRFAEYHRENPDWGILHIVLEERNHQDRAIQGVISSATYPNDVEGRELARILLRMSRTQRGKIDRLCREMTG